MMLRSQGGKAREVAQMELVQLRQSEDYPSFNSWLDWQDEVDVLSDVKEKKKDNAEAALKELLLSWRLKKPYLIYCCILGLSSLVLLIFTAYENAPSQGISQSVVLSSQSIDGAVPGSTVPGVLTALGSTSVGLGEQGVSTTQEWHWIAEICEATIGAILVIETFVTFVMLGRKSFWASWWCRFDLLVSVLTILVFISMWSDLSLFDEIEEYLEMPILIVRFALQPLRLIQTAHIMRKARQMQVTANSTKIQWEVLPSEEDPHYPAQVTFGHGVIGHGIHDRAHGNAGGINISQMIDSINLSHGTAEDRQKSKEKAQRFGGVAHAAGGTHGHHHGIGITHGSPFQSDASISTGTPHIVGRSMTSFFSEQYRENTRDLQNPLDVIAGSPQGARSSGHLSDGSASNAPLMNTREGSGGATGAARAPGSASSSSGTSFGYMIELQPMGGNQVPPRSPNAMAPSPTQDNLQDSAGDDGDRCAFREYLSTITECLPLSLRFASWTLCYKPSVHGMSHFLFAKLLEEAGPVVVLVRDNDEGVFGAYSEEFKHFQKEQRSASTFVFTFVDRSKTTKTNSQDFSIEITDSQDSADAVSLMKGMKTSDSDGNGKQYNSTSFLPGVGILPDLGAFKVGFYSNETVFATEKDGKRKKPAMTEDYMPPIYWDDEMLCFGESLIIDTRELLRGTSKPCSVYGMTEPLSKEVDFIIKDLEVWRFT